MRLSLGCAWLALFSLMPAQAQTATTKKTAAASASFAYVSDDGCVHNEVILFANRTTVVSAKPPRTTAEVPGVPTFGLFRWKRGAEENTPGSPFWKGSVDFLQ